MGNEWELPQWRQEGRTGPGLAALRYAKRRDRAAVRKGKPVGGGGKKGNNGRKGDRSGGASKSAMVIAWGLLALPGSAIATALAYVLHGHGVL